MRLNSLLSASRDGFQILISLFVVTACSISSIDPAQKANDPYRGHYIVIGKEGDPAELDGQKIAPGKFIAVYVDAIKQGINRHLQSLRDSQPGRVLVFVHGGLNTYADNRQRMNDLVKFQKGSPNIRGRLMDTAYYPIFINWEAGPFTALADDIFVVRQGQRPQGFLDWLAAVTTVPFVLLSRVGEGLLRAPTSFWYMADNFFRESFRQQNGTQRAENGAINTPLIPLRLLTLPFIDGFGSPVWEMLKRRTDLMVTKEKGKAGALGILLSQLICGSEIKKDCFQLKNKKTFWISDSQPKKIEITLMGHSMGTLVLDSIITFFPIPYKRIIYMAAASSIEDVEFSIYSHLRTYDKSKFYAFNLSRGDEARETMFFPFERGSLLVWIDSYLERVNRPDQLRFGRQRNLGPDYRSFTPETDLSARFTMRHFHGADGEPRIHTDFSTPEIIKRILCTVDSSAFPGTEPKCEPYVD